MKYFMPGSGSRCRHENADHLMPGELLDFDEPHTPPQRVTVEQFRCLDCGEFLSLGSAASAPWIEMQLAIAIAHIECWDEDERTKDFYVESAITSHAENNVDLHAYVEDMKCKHHDDDTRHWDEVQLKWIEVNTCGDCHAVFGLGRAPLPFLEDHELAERLADIAIMGVAPPEHSSTLRWIPDQDDPDSVDDLFAKRVDFRMERMDNGHYWMAIFLDDGTEHHFDITSKRKIRAFARQPAPTAGT